jgi:hypothetical protein
MGRRGLPPSLARIKEETRFKDFVESGGLDEVLRRASVRASTLVKKGGQHGAE